MTYPEYDLTLYPCIELPFNNQKEATKKYLGNKAVTGDEYVNINFFIVNDAEMETLYNFWKNDCNYGTTPFLIPLPLFGETPVIDMPKVVLQFIDDISVEKSDTNWKQNVRCKVIGTIEYVTDDAGNYVTDDAGDFIYSDPSTNSNKEITYG